MTPQPVVLMTPMNSSYGSMSRASRNTELLPHHPSSARPPSRCLPCLHDCCEVLEQSRKRPGRRTWKYQSGKNPNKKLFTNVTQTAKLTLEPFEHFADVSLKLVRVTWRNIFNTKLLIECRGVSFVSENNQNKLPCFSWFLHKTRRKPMDQFHQHMASEEVLVELPLTHSSNSQS